MLLSWEQLSGPRPSWVGFSKPPRPPRHWLLLGRCHVSLLQFQVRSDIPSDPGGQVSGHMASRHCCIPVTAPVLPCRPTVPAPSVTSSSHDPREQHLQPWKTWQVLPPATHCCPRSLLQSGVRPATTTERGGYPATLGLLGTQVCSQEPPSAIPPTQQQRVPPYWACGDPERPERAQHTSTMRTVGSTMGVT